jgi:ATP-binding cassette, subfamily B, bacterial PglK
MLDALRRCLGLLGPGHAGRWVVVVVLAVIASALEVLGALLVFALLARITTDASGFDLPLVGDMRVVLPDADERTLLLVVGAGLAAFFAFRAVVIVGQAYVQYRVAENAGARLATRLLQGYLAMPYSFHLKRNSAELVRNSYDTVQQFSREALVPAVKLVSQVAMVVGMVLLLLLTNPLATVSAVAALGPLTWVLLRVVHPRVKVFGGHAQAMSRTSLQTLQESLAGWRDITILGRRREFVEAFRRDRRNLARARYLRATAKELPRVVLETGLVLFILAFLGASVLLGDGALNALPVLGLFGYAALRLQPSLNEIMVALNSLKFVGPGIDLLHADLQLFEQAGEDDEADAPHHLHAELRLHGVDARYPEAHENALSGVDLTIRAGEFIGIVGPTGGGKSTLVDLMLGFLPPARGTVSVDGVDVHEDLAAWHAGIGVVHQSVFLADATLRRNVALGVPDAEIDETRVREALSLAQLDAFVAALPQGLETTVGEDGVRLSGGQRQRLAIARALYRRPSTLFFDEGTSALDRSTEAQLMGALEALRGQRTIIAVAHRLSTVEACDRVVLVEGGRIVDVAPFRELSSRHHRLLGAATT